MELYNQIIRTYIENIHLFYRHGRHQKGNKDKQLVKFLDFIF